MVLRKKLSNNSQLYVMTQEEVAKELGLTRQTVTHIEKRAIEKVLKALKKKGVKKGDML